MLYRQGRKNLRIITVSVIGFAICFWASQVSAAEITKAAQSLPDSLKQRKMKLH